MPLGEGSHVGQDHSLQVFGGPGQQDFQARLSVEGTIRGLGLAEAKNKVEGFARPNG